MKWNELTPMRKIGFVILCIGAALMLVGAMKPELFPIDMTTIALVVMSVGEAMDHWEEKRKWAYLFIAAAVICLACFLVGLFL